MAILVAFQLSACMLEFTPVSERIASLRGGDGSYGPNTSSAFPSFLESLEGILGIL